MALVDESSPERLSGEMGAAHREVTLRPRFHLTDRIRVEASLDPCPGGCYADQCRGVDDLLRRPPYLLKVEHHRRPVGERHRFPVRHHLVHPASEEVGADGPFEVVDERVHLLVRGSPLEAALRVGHVAVERGDRGVDQLGHGDRYVASPSLRGAVRVPS